MPMNVGSLSPQDMAYMANMRPQWMASHNNQDPWYSMLDGDRGQINNAINSIGAGDPGFLNSFNPSTYNGPLRALMGAYTGPQAMGFGAGGQLTPLEHGGNPTSSSMWAAGNPQVNTPQGGGGAFGGMAGAYNQPYPSQGGNKGGPFQVPNGPMGKAPYQVPNGPGSSMSAGGAMYNPGMGGGMGTLGPSNNYGGAAGGYQRPYPRMYPNMGGGGYGGGAYRQPNTKAYGMGWNF